MPIGQRPSRLDELTLSRCNAHIIVRLVDPADQRFLRRVGGTPGEEEARMLPDPEVGGVALACFYRYRHREVSRLQP